MNRVFTRDGTILQYRKLVADAPYTITNKVQNYFMAIFNVTAQIQILFEEAT